ncbi:DUF3053 domain-containing protein [Nocardioides lianchengensis]|uniref:DUF3053 domain-containing protein n=1 Tax=Nocardioides lianchengensis TaxID=1045774 RepID=UPI0011136462|nr:DUF3053 domain-containing protein [Nocardioides lianchengensis]NYG10210.1 hypothetical protein [Nocardioides lianchengensis]
MGNHRIGRARRRARSGVALLALVLLPLTACAGDPAEDYCATVQEHQEELTEIVAAGGPTALLGALDAFRDLQEQAPGDIRDEWQQVVGRLDDLEEALEDADVDPQTYDAAEPPDDLSAADRSRIAAAGRALVAPETADALEALQQQARDVCKTPLTL